MKIMLDENYRIITDEKQYILQEIKIKGEDSAKAGEVYYNIVGYYSTLQNALRGFKEKHIRLSDAEGLRAVMTLLRSIDAKIDAIKIERD